MRRTAAGLRYGVAAGTAVALLALAPAPLSAQQSADGVVIDGNDIGGVVSGPHGLEAGVWVIAETRELPTRFARMVVTDDRGRYVLPDLPMANYRVWVRGYGLVDSPKVRATPGRILNLTAVQAPTRAAAAHYYPAIYWYSMLKIPDKSLFGGSSAIPAKITQTDWLSVVKNRSCIGCHQLGQESTRTFPAAFAHFKSSEEAWMRRVQSGQAGPTWWGRSPASSAECRSNTSPTGPTASPGASFPTAPRRGRREWSATWW